MPLKVEKTKLEGVLVITPPTIHEDYRGEYVETYNEKLYEEELYRAGALKGKFVQDDISVSTRNVLRGLHGDDRTWKLVSCLYGRIWLVVVNWIDGHPQYRMWESFALSDRNHLQVLIPPKFANGHLVMTKVAIFSYKQSEYYEGQGKQFVVRWDDPSLGLWWPIANPILSERDKSGSR